MQFEAPFNVNPIDYMCELKLANLSQKIRLEASIIICCHLKKWNGKSKRILNCTIALILHFQTCLLYLQSCICTNPKSEHFSGSVSRLRGPTRQSPTSSGQTGLRPGWEFLVHSTKKMDFKACFSPFLTNLSPLKTVLGSSSSLNCIESFRLGDVSATAITIQDP